MHVPVLLQEAMTFLDPKPGDFIIDGTFGGGGYARVIADRIGHGGTLLGLDLDAGAIDRARAWKACAADTAPDMSFEAASFSDIPDVLSRLSLRKANGLVLDLGFSSDELESSGRGFSFSPERADEPLFMTYSDTYEPVYEILAHVTESALEEVLREYGDERYARRIARAIIAARKTQSIRTVGTLAGIVRRAVPANYERGRINPATRTFQALRIYANRELEHLEAALNNLHAALLPGGRAVIVSFHSLEDRAVKQRFREYAKEGRLEVLTKKPVTASAAEVRANTRARSAKLRAGKIPS